MKILIINNCATIAGEVGGFFVHKSTGEFAVRLIELGHQVEFFQFAKVSATTNNYFELAEYNIAVSGSMWHRSKVINYIKAYLTGVIRVLKNDYVYVFYPNTLSLLLVFAILFRKRYGLYVRGEKNIRNRFSKFLYKNAASIFTVSEMFTKDINEEIGVSKAVTVKAMIPFTETDILRDREYGKKDKFTVLFLGRIDKDKGIYELLESVKVLKETGKFDILVEVVGDGAILEAVKKRSIEMGIADIIRFFGSIFEAEKIKDRYIAADVFVLPTHHEGFPRTLYEAMIFGVPIITTFVGTIPGLMKDGVNCFKIQPRSVQSLVEKLSMVMSDYSMVEDIVRNAHDTVYPLVLREKPTHPEMLHEAITRNH